MSTRHEITNGCSNPDCDGTAVGKTGYCAKDIAAYEAEGWKFRASGMRVRDGIKVMPSGRVSVQPGTYNSRTLALLAGDLPVEDLDDEELARGMCRNEDGTFPKRDPEMVPKVIHDRMMRHLMERAEEGLRRGLMDCVEAMVGIAGNDAVAPGDRMRAATFVIERVMGKTPERVLVGQEKPFEVVLDKIVRGPRTRQIPEAG